MALKVEELRVGNLVADRAGKVLRVDEFNRIKVEHRQYVMGIEVHPLTESLNFANGIPLTENWLLNFGFAQHLGTNNGWHYGLNPVTDDYYVFIKKTSKGFIFQNGGHPIQFVHQLQNLCFALTGEELTPKTVSI